MKDESQVEIVELSDNDFTVDNNDIKDEYENETENQEEHTNNEEYEIQEKSISEEHELECYECRLTFSKLFSLMSRKLFNFSCFYFKMRNHHCRNILKQSMDRRYFICVMCAGKRLLRNHRLKVIWHHIIQVSYLMYKSDVFLPK